MIIMTLEEKITQFSKILNKKAFAHLSTIMPDGSPQVTPVWFSIENNQILINTAVNRRKDKNMTKNPNVALSIQDPDNPYNYVGIRGVVVERALEGADKHINSLAKKYLGMDEYPYRSSNEMRVIYKIKPETISGINGE